MTVNLEQMDELLLNNIFSNRLLKEEKLMFLETLVGLYNHLQS